MVRIAEDTKAICVTQECKNLPWIGKMPIRADRMIDVFLHHLLSGKISAIISMLSFKPSQVWVGA